VPKRIATVQNLPKWASNRLGRALVSAIIAERPDCFVTSGESYNSGGRTIYKGKVAGQLRRLHREWMEREFARQDEQFRITGIWDQAASNAVCGAEEADALIGRILRETEQQIEVAA
jgi:hypothetical protein